MLVFLIKLHLSGSKKSKRKKISPDKKRCNEIEEQNERY